MKKRSKEDLIFAKKVEDKRIKLILLDLVKQYEYLTDFLVVTELMEETDYPDTIIDKKNLREIKEYLEKEKEEFFKI